jgi:aryl-alcohol dehydrogenase-like predicted oxidoreductase
MARIGLGTVQFGLDYGISNANGKTVPSEARAILAAARRGGVEVLDTAPAYGTSEAVLGELGAAAMGFRIVTKTPKFEGKASDADTLERSLTASLEYLKLATVDALLFHRASDLLGSSGTRLMAKARELQGRGLIGKIGVSVYDGDEIDAVMEKHGAEIIQAPINVLDQRLLESGHLRALQAAGVEVHARSVFLQGLLLMDPKSLPPHLAKGKAPLQAFRALAQDHSLTPLEAALGFVLGLLQVDVALVGVNDAAQLEAILARAKALIPREFSSLSVRDASLLNPSQWEAAR